MEILNLFKTNLFTEYFDEIKVMPKHFRLQLCKKYFSPPVLF